MARQELHRQHGRQGQSCRAAEGEIEGHRQRSSKKKAEAEGKILRRRGKGAELEAKGEVDAAVVAEGLRKGGSGRGAVEEKEWGKDRGAKVE